MIRVQVPATTANLGPGFDCLGMALELYNVVEMSPGSRGLFIEVQGEGTLEIPRDERNLVYQAALRVFRQTGFSPQGLKIRLINQIPAARGLGSSTAALVGGIIAANLLSGGSLSVKEVINLACAMEGHPDNAAPAVLGGIVVAVQAEGEVKHLKIQPPASLKGVVAIPDFTLPTRPPGKFCPSRSVFRTLRLMWGGWPC